MSAERNARVQARYDALMREGKHGHYETLFRVVREEVDAEHARAERLAGEFEHLIERCDTSDDARYGTLGTTFVREHCRAALAAEPEVE